MGWIAAAGQLVREAFGVPRPITLDLSPVATFDTAPRPVDRVIAEMKAGTGRVSRDQALQVSAVQRGRNEICSISTLPVRLYKGLEVVESPLFRQWDPDVPNVVHMAMTVEDLAFEAVAWWQVTGQSYDQFPVSVRRIDPGKIRIDPPRDNQMTEAERKRWVWIDHGDGRGWQQWPAALMIKFESPNPGILNVNSRAIRIASRLDALTEMYAENPALREYFTDGDNQDVDPMDDDEIDAWLAEYGAMRRIRPYGWIPSTVKRADVSAPSPKDLTLVELRQEVHLAIANGLGVDPEDLGVSTTSRTYFNSVDKKQDKINRVYAAYMKAITDRLSMGDVTPRGYSVQFDLTDYLKSSPAEQAAYWAQLKGMGVTDAAEIRGWAGLSGAPPAQPATTPAQLPTTAARFADDGPSFRFHATDFAIAPPAPTVDTAGRTITGLAVPYNAVAVKYGMKIKFAPGSLEYSEPGRMAHLKDHQTPVGFHRSVKDTPAGPMVELAVLDGPEGSPAKLERDQLLYDAEHGLYSGLSIGVDFSYFPEDGDVEIDPDTGEVTVIRASWRETSSTYMPAFDDARVTKVAAARTGDPVDPCQHCGQRHAPNIACATFAAQVATQPNPTPVPGQPAPPPAPVPTPGQPDTAQFAEILRAFMAGQPIAANGGPSPVALHRNVAQVNEPTPYVFDRAGNLRPGSHDFSSDLFAGWAPGGGGDATARDRAETFLREQFAVTPANVVNLNYPQNRPDLYVDQQPYQYPVWDAINKGTLADMTPFVVPKFSTATGLVADHVTGTEPTPGAFTATAQTITPSPVSGKVEVTREAWDQGGNPQMSGLIWAKMTRAYFEALEAFAIAQFVANAASIADLTITTAATDATLDQAIADALIPLQYARGGDRFRKVFTQIDLYKAMVKAKDTTGRRLYPALGPMNATGTTDPAYATIDAHGKLWIPAWATAATSVNAASSYMFDPGDVNGWASTPQRIDLEWRVAWVDIGIWGYKAFAITDFTGVRELVYDPV